MAVQTIVALLMLLAAGLLLALVSRSGDARPRAAQHRAPQVRAVERPASAPHRSPAPRAGFSGAGWVDSRPPLRHVPEGVRRRTVARR